MPPHNFCSDVFLDRLPEPVAVIEAPQKNFTSCIRGCCQSNEVPLDLKKQDFKILSEIARGAESVVYKGSMGGAPVAVKRPTLASAEDMNRFHEELQLLSTLRHPNIACLKAARAHPPDYALIFDFYQHGNLFDALHRHETHLSQRQVLAIALQIGSALQYLHHEGIVHRDIKPANILVDDNGGVHLTDFGLAAPVISLERHTASNWKGQGKPTGGFHKKNMVGTLPYMAPEVLKKEVHTDKSDVFSFAISINEVATGVIPYSDRTTDPKAHTVLEMNYTEQQLTAAITSDGLRPFIAVAGPSVIPGLPELIEKCWSTDPAARPTMDEVMDSLRLLAGACSEGEEDKMNIEFGSANNSILRNGTESDKMEVDHMGLPKAKKQLTWADLAAADVSTRRDDARIGDADVSNSGYLPTISSGAFATTGARDKMEDRHFVQAHLGEAEHVHAFGVFDGHRGYEAAEFAAASVPRRLSANLATMSPRAALTDAFVATDATFRKELEAQRSFRLGGGLNWHPGCTAATALIMNDRLFVANAGDCRTVLCRNGQAVPLSRDHIASDPAERERVQQAGGSVQWRVNTWRVGKAAIEVTRSLGDGDLKPSVTAEPEILEHVLGPQDEFLVMASDGLWEKMTNEEMVSFVYDTVKEPSMCGKRLAIEAANRGSKDNISVVVVYLRPVSTVERIY